MTFARSEESIKAEIDAYNALSEEECKDIRYNWDFVAFPQFFHNDKKGFIKLMLFSGAKTILTNLYRKAYFDAPYALFQYVSNQIISSGIIRSKYFNVLHIQLGQKKNMIYVNLPDEHKGSALYCSAFVFSYEKTLFGIKNIEFFMIEKDTDDRYWLGTVTDTGEHITYAEIPEEDAYERMVMISHFVSDDAEWRNVLVEDGKLIG